jgi:methionyl-tRNA synthetase
MIDAAREAMERQALTRMLEAIWQVVGDADRYFASEQPWALKKTDPRRMGTVLYVAAEVVRQTAILVQPTMPAAAQKLIDQLGLSGAQDFTRLGSAGRLTPGAALGPLQGVFPRYIEPETPAAD